MQIKVTYRGGEVNLELDKRIKEALEAIGAKWYASGMEIDTGIRDICFDVDD